MADDSNGGVVQRLEDQVGCVLDKWLVKFLIPFFVLKGDLAEPAVREVMRVPLVICRDVEMVLRVVAELPACCDCYSVSKHVLTQLRSIVAVLCLPEDDVGFAKEVGGIKTA